MKPFRKHGRQLNTEQAAAEFVADGLNVAQAEALAEWVEIVARENGVWFDADAGRLQRELNVRVFSTIDDAAEFYGCEPEDLYIGGIVKYKSHSGAVVIDDRGL